jgi:DNA-binding transcriptional regulator YiaG
MTQTKKKTLTYEAFGFPIKLINVPMKKVVGEWVIDVNFDALEKTIARLLLRKAAPLTGAELRFIRKYLGFTTTELGELLGITHVAVVKWESGKTRPTILADIYVRLYVIDHLQVKDKEFRSLFEETSPSLLKEAKKKRPSPLVIDIDEELLSA